MAGSISATTASLIAAAVGAAGVGTGVYESVHAGNVQNDAQKANQQALLKQQQSQANQANLTKQQAVLSQQGQAQQQTGGSLTDDGTTALTDLLAGYPGFQGGAGTNSAPGAGIGASGANGGTAAPAAAGSGGGTGTPDIAAILASLRGGGTGGQFGGGSGNLSGGNWQSQPSQPQSSFELSNPPLT
jgi:hypothetical protein